MCEYAPGEKLSDKSTKAWLLCGIRECTTGAWRLLFRQPIIAFLCANEIDEGEVAGG
jgi:hypothetical protein